MRPHFINSDMFLDYWGMNLSEKLRSDDNPSDTVDTFLARVETRLMNWIDSNTFRNIDYRNLTAFQLYQFRLALLEQAMYMWRNGDIGMDSGYDVEKGVVGQRSTLKYIEVAQPAINALIKAGLFNQKMKAYPHFLHGWGASLGYFGAQNDRATLRWSEIPIYFED